MARCCPGNCHKMKHQTNGQPHCEVTTALALYGDAGQGESNIRPLVHQNEWLEAIVALR